MEMIDEEGVVSWGVAQVPLRSASVALGEPANHDNLPWSLETKFFTAVYFL
jgi:hypothetical protein